MKTEELNNCVVYFHINLIKNEVFYVGIGSRKERPFSKIHRSELWHNIVNKYGYDILIIEEGLTWIEACEREKYYINWIGRRDLGLGTLVNHTNGGEGIVGRIVSLETRIKISKSKIGKSSYNKGLKHSKESRKKMSDAKKGYIPWNKNKKNCFTDEQLSKMSKAQKGRKLTLERKIQILKSSGGCHILQYDLNGYFIKEFFSLRECLKYGYKGVKSAFYKDKKSYRKFSGGFLWVKKIDEEIKFKIDI